MAFKKSIYVVVILFAFVALLPQMVEAKEESQQLGLIKNPVTEIISTAQEARKSGGDARIEYDWVDFRDILRIGEVINYEEMSRRILGRRWEKLNYDQKKAFIFDFSRLADTVLLRKLVYNSGIVIVKEYYSSFVKNKYVIDTLVKKSKGGYIPITFRLTCRMNTDWKVYDISIEGVSMVVRYRAEFRNYLLNIPLYRLDDGQDGGKNLIKEIEKRNDKLETAGPDGGLFSDMLGMKFNFQ